MKKRYILLAVVAVLLTIGGLSAPVWLSVVAYYVATFAAAQEYKDVASVAVVKPPPPTESFNFEEDFRVNTADQDATHFIKLQLSLGFETNNPALSAELAERREQLRNIVNLILAGKTKAQLSTIQDQLELREEIKKSINHILAEGTVTELYFNEFIVN